MCPTHILVHRTPPLRGGVHCAWSGGYKCFQGVNILPYGWLHKPLLSRVKVSETCVQPFQRYWGFWVFGGFGVFGDFGMFGVLGYFGVLGVLGCFRVLGCFGMLGCFGVFGGLWVFCVLGCLGCFGVWGF